MPQEITLGSHTLNGSPDTCASFQFSDNTVDRSQYGTLFIIQYDVQFKKIIESFTFNIGYPNNISVINGLFTIYY